MITAVAAFLGVAAIKRFLITSTVVFGLGFFGGAWCVWQLWDVANSHARIAALQRDLAAAAASAELAQKQADELREALDWNTKISQDINTEVDRAPVVRDCITPGFLDGLRRLK